ncbi:MAG: hypothetical protein ACK53Y_08060, partial [bacterium]
MTQYQMALHELLASNNVFQRLDNLQEKINTKQWTSESQKDYESLDKTITESLLTAENNLSKCITTTYQWSPTLKKAVQQLRYWSMRLQQARNQP